MPHGQSERLTDKEITHRMLRAAREQVALAGLTVSLDHLVFEQLIQAAGVSRTAVFRIWNHKQAFYDDLLIDLAGPNWQGTAAFDQETIDLAERMIAENADLLATAAGRHTLLIKICRLGSEQNFRALVRSQEWRAYIVVTAARLSSPSTETQAKIQTALVDAETKFTDQMATFYKTAAAAVGYRLRPEFGGDYRTLAALGAAVVEGMGLRQAVSPEIVARRFTESVFSAGTGERDWSLASIGFTAVLTSMVEPIPEHP